MFYMESPELSFAACVTSHFCFLRNKKLAVHMKNRHPCPNNNHILRNDTPFVYKLQVSIDGWEGTYKDSKMVQNGNFVRYELINNIRMLCWMRKI